MLKGRSSLMAWGWLAWWAFSLLIPGVASAGEAPVTLVLTNGTVIDGTGAPPFAAASVEIAGNRISAIRVGGAPARRADGDTRVVDLQGGFVLPGLWNSHVHLGDLLPDPKNLLEQEPLWRAWARAGRNAMDALRRGFTTLRGAGDRDYLDVAWKRLFDAGVFVGPRIIPCGNPISSAPDDDWLTVTPDGPEQAREVVRTHIRNGVELIKIIATRMRADEIAAVVDEAHAHGLKVFAHAYDNMGHVAVDLGVDGIEHGSKLSDETIRVMADRGMFLDPTIVCNLSAQYIAERERRIQAAGFGSPADVVEGRILVAKADERSQAQAERAREVLQKAYAAGVKITAGSDSNPLAELGILEIEQLAFSGLPEMAAIMAGTRNSAEAAGRLDELGTVEVGKIADLIVLSRNPLENISNLRALTMVIKDGRLVDLGRDWGQASFWKLYLLD